MDALEWLPAAAMVPFPLLWALHRPGRGAYARARLGSEAVEPSWWRPAVALAWLDAILLPAVWIIACLGVGALVIWAIGWAEAVFVLLALLAVWSMAEPGRWDQPFGRFRAGVRDLAALLPPLVPLVQAAGIALSV